MKQLHAITLLTFSICLVFSCNKPRQSPSDPVLPDPVVNKIIPSNGPADTKVSVEFDRFINPSEAPTKLLVAGVSIPFTHVTGGSSFANLEFIVPKGMKSGKVQVEWKGKLLNGPDFTYDSLYYVSTIAGNPQNPGGADGPLATASFTLPSGVAVDKDGNIYVCEPMQHRIRKISVAGQVTTLAGNGTAGYAEGQGSAARFNEPRDLAVDMNGNVFVTDRGNRRIRKISPDGTTSSFAGNGSSGNFEGQGAAAAISEPFGIDIDKNGNLFVTSGMQVLKITAAAQMTILAGNVFSGDADGTGTNAAFSNPLDVAVNDNGDLFVCENGNNKIKKVTQAGVATTFAGGSLTWGYVNATGTAARFGNPTSLVIGGDNNIYCLEYTNCLVRIITPQAVVGTFAGVYGFFGYKDALAGKSLFNDPYGIATDKKGNFYIADNKNHCIRKISRE